MSRWFRLYDEMLDDPKVQMLPPELFKTWVNLLAVASRNDGTLQPVTQLAFALRVSPTDMQSRLDDLILAGLLDIQADGRIEPHNWKIRQWKSDDSADRVRKHRAMKRDEKQPRNVACNGAVTVTVTPPDTDTEAETEKIECVGAREGLIETEETIGHRAFVISLPAIELAVIRSGLPKAEIRTRCKAHALQWAAEIDAGKLSRDVLPQKIVNFLASTIMGEVNRDSRPIHRATGYPAPAPKRGVMDVIREAQAREAVA